MARNSAAARAHKAANKAHYSELLEGFAGQYDITLEQYGDGIHWRLMSKIIVLDVWPTTGSYYIKDIKRGNADRMGETGKLPWDYIKGANFLYTLFGIPENERL